VRLVFLGTAAFAVPALRACIAHHDVRGVVTQPAKPGHRGAPAARPVAEVAQEHGVPVLTPPRIREPEAVEAVRQLQPDAIVVAAYGQILPQALLDVPEHGAVNVHASLLPRWRGASPVAHAILAGDGETGVTIMQMDAGLDTGPMHAQRRVPIARDATTPALTALLADAGAELLVEVLARIGGGTAVTTPQPAAGVTLAPRLRREDGDVEWSTHTAIDIDRRVRALQPWPGVSAPLAGVAVRILEGRALDDGGEGDAESLVVTTHDGLFRIDRVLPPGSRPMTPQAFLRGRRNRSASS